MHEGDHLKRELAGAQVFPFALFMPPVHILPRQYFRKKL